MAIIIKKENQNTQIETNTKFESPNNQQNNSKKHFKI